MAYPAFRRCAPEGMRFLVERRNDMMSPIAAKLYRSLKSGDPDDLEWFEELSTASIQGRGTLFDLFWQAVREILDEVSPDWRDAPPSPEPLPERSA